MILLDTHVLVWLALNAPRLGRRALARIDRALQGDGVGVSAISFWEIAILSARGRLRPRIPAEEFRARCLSMAIAEVPVNGAIAILAAQLQVGADPADRLIGATALQTGATLATADQALLAWKHGPRLLDVTR